MDDKRIIALFFERDEEGIKAARQKYNRYLESIAQSMLASKEEAEECVSDTYLAAWNSIPPNKPDSLMAYLVRLTRNLSLDRLDKQNAKKRKSEALPLLEEIAEIVVSEQDSLTDSLALREAINQFLKQLPKEKRILFMRRYFFFDTVEEIAEAEKVSESKIKTALYRIRLDLKDYLLCEGFVI